MANAGVIGNPQGGRIPLKMPTVLVTIGKTEQRQLKGGVREFTAYIVDVLIRKPKPAEPEPAEPPSSGSRSARRRTRKLKAPPSNQRHPRGGNTGLEPEMTVTELDTQELQQLSVAKRYSEFLAFHKSWTSKFPKLGKQGFVMPKKKWFNNMSEEFINQRRIALNTYLQQCMRVAELIPQLFRWLEIDHIVPKLVQEAETKTDAASWQQDTKPKKKKDRNGPKINPAQLTRRRTRDDLMAALLPAHRRPGSELGTMVPTKQNLQAMSTPSQGSSRRLDASRRMESRRSLTDASSNVVKEAEQAVSGDEQKHLDQVVMHSLANIEQQRQEEEKNQQHDVFTEFAMLRAVTSGDLKRVKELVESGLPVNTKLGYLRETALMWAVNRQQNSVVRYLLSKGAKVIEPYREHINPPVASDIGFAPLPFVTLESSDSDSDSYSDYSTDEDRSDTELRNSDTELR